MLNQMYNTLYKHPVVGFLSGIASAIGMQITHLFTDESVLKIVSGAGIWAGTTIAVCTAIIQVARVSLAVWKRYKAWRNPPAATVVFVIMLAFTLAGCGARKVELQTSRSKTKIDSTYSNQHTGVRTGIKASSTALASTGTQIYVNGSQLVDTGRSELASKTTIAAQFAPGTGPTAADVAAAAGDQAKTAQLLNRAISLSLTTDQKLTEQKALSAKYFELAQAIDEYTYQAKMLALTKDSITANSKGSLKKESEAERKDKHVDRAGVPWSDWLVISILIIVCIVIVWMAIKGKL